MKNRSIVSAFVILVLLLSSISFGNSSPAKKATLNRDLIVINLLNGINSDNEGLKYSSAYFLGDLKSKESVIPLLKILHNDKNDEARIMAALSLSKIKDARGIFAVKQAIKFDKSDRVKKMCSIFYKDYLSKNKF